jgi:hypothetical protein
MLADKVAGYGFYCCGSIFSCHLSNILEVHAASFAMNIVYLSRLKRGAL